MDLHVSTPPNPTTRAPTEERGEGAPWGEARRGNRAQLIVGGAVALVLIGTTAFVLLREPGSNAPESPPAVEPAPAAPPALPPRAPITPPVTVAPPVARPPVAPPPAAATGLAAPPAPPSASTDQEPQPEAKPSLKGRNAAGNAEHPSARAVYTLQLNSFLVPANATALIARLNARGGTAYEKVETDPDGKSWHKVRFGAFDSEAEAQAAADDLKQSEGIGALIVRSMANAN